MELERRVLRKEDVINKSFVVYGGSGSGKTRVVRDLLDLIVDEVSEIWICSQTEPTNNIYKNHGFPATVIQGNITEEWLRSIWDRNEVRVQMAAYGNNEKNLKSIFDILCEKCDGSRWRKAIDGIAAKHAEAVEEIMNGDYNDDERKSKISEKDASLSTMRIKIYKGFIRQRTDYIDEVWDKLTSEERKCYENINTKCNIVVIADDCTSDFKNFKTKTGAQTLNKYAFQCRWNGITIIFTCHMPSAMEKSIRTGAMMSIFAGEDVLSSFVSNVDNGIKKYEKEINAVAKNMKFGSPEWQKILYARLEGNFYYFKERDISPMSNFYKRIQNPSYKKFVEGVAKQSSASSLSSNNKYSAKFKAISGTPKRK